MVLWLGTRVFVEGVRLDADPTVLISKSGVIMKPRSQGCREN